MRHVYTLLFLLLTSSSFGQFQTVGNAISLGNDCFEVTPAFNNQISAFWHTVPIDLNNPFEFYGEVFLGCNDNGGDGMTFTMHNDPRGINALGNFGNFLGYAGSLGITPSIAIEFDTYRLGGSADLFTDHTAIFQNGSVDHAGPDNLAGPIDLAAGGANQEDCAFHDVHILWDPFTQTLSMWWDCDLRISYTGDIVNDIFGGNSQVLWGFTGSSGAVNNSQRVCVHEYYNEPVNRILCAGDSIDLDAGPGINYFWFPFTDISDPLARTPQVWPNSNATYTVAVQDSCGFLHTYTYTIQVDDPNAILLDMGQDFSLCNGQDSTLDLSRPGVSYLWQDGSTNGDLFVSTPGLYWLEVSNFCGTNRDSVSIGLLTPPVIDLGPDDTSCFGDTLLLDIPLAGTNFLWQDGSMDSTFEVTQSGLYFVTASNQCGTDTDSTIKTFFEIPAVSLPNDTFFCAGRTRIIDPITTSNVSFLWQDGSGAPSYTATSAGLYWLEIANQCGLDRDSLILSPLDVPVVDLGADDSLCLGDTVTLDVTNPFSSYTWQNGSNDSIFVVFQSGIFSVTVSNLCGVAQDTVTLTFQEPPMADLGNDTVICDSSVLVLDATSPGAIYVWQDGVGTPTYNVNQAGTYSVAVSTACAVVRDTIQVDYSIPPTVDIGPDRSICEGEQVIFDATSPIPGITYVWQDGTNSPGFVANTQGTYFVTLLNVCGFDIDSAFLEVLSPLTTTDLADTTQYCIGDTLTLRTGLDSSQHIWADQSTEPFLQVFEPGDYFVTIINACGALNDTATVVEVTPPQVELGEDLTLCEGRTVTLNASWPYTQVLWENNTSQTLRTVSETGIYSATLSNVCGTTSDAIALTFSPAPDPVDLGDDRALCEGDSVIFDVTQPNLIPQPLYSWQDNQMGPVYTARFGGFYQVVVRNECGESVAQVNLTEVPTPEVRVFGDSVFCESETAILEAFSPTSTPITWPDGTVGSGFIVQEPGLIIVTAENDCGVGTDTLSVRQADCFCRISVPNAFTPNGDGFNEGFRVVAACNIESGFWRVVDRWGSTVFESNDPAVEWFGKLPNGKDAPDGVYVWMYQFLTRGEGAEMVTREESGTVTLFR